MKLRDDFRNYTEGLRQVLHKEIVMKLEMLLQGGGWRKWSQGQGRLLACLSPLNNAHLPTDV